MGLILLIIISFLVSIDASCVSMSNGLINYKFGYKKIFFMAFIFGFMQGLMAFLGHYFYRLINPFFYEFEYYFNMIIFGFLGTKMILDSFKDDNKDRKNISYMLLFFQSILVSIDSLLVGVGIEFVYNNIFICVSFISIITFSFVLISFYIGKKFGIIYQKKAKVFGGIMLIMISLRILLYIYF